MSPVFMEITVRIGVLAKHAEVRGADVPFRSTLARRVRAE